MCWDKCFYYLITDHNYTTMVGSSVLICYLSWLVPHPFKYPKVVKRVHVGPENSYGKGQSTFASNNFTRFAVISPIDIPIDAQHLKLMIVKLLISLRNTNLISYLTLYYLLTLHIYRSLLPLSFFAEREINRKKNIIQRSKSTISLLYRVMWLLVSQWVPCILGYIFSYKTIFVNFFPDSFLFNACRSRVATLLHS